MPRTWKGDKALTRLLVPLDDLHPHPDNARLGNVEAIARSLERFGQLRPIVANAETAAVAAGNHTWRAAQALGWSHIAAVRVTFDDEMEERAYLLADNRISDLATYEPGALVTSLTLLAEHGKLAGTGYDEDYLNDLLAEQAALAEQARAEFDPDPDPPPRLDERNPAVVEVVLAYTGDEHKDFTGFVRALAKEYGTKTVGETVLRALRGATRDADE